MVVFPGQVLEQRQDRLEAKLEILQYFSSELQVEVRDLINRNSLRPTSLDDGLYVGEDSSRDWGNSSNN